MFLPALLAASVARFDPCALVTRGDIGRILAWRAGRGVRKPYRLPEESGTLCSYDAPEGTLVVQAPDGAATALTSSVADNPLQNGTGTTVTVGRATVYLFNGSAYVTERKRNVIVKVLPENDDAGEDVLMKFARLVVRRMN